MDFSPINLNLDLYLNLFRWFITALCIAISIRYISSTDNSNLLKSYTPFGAVLLSVVLIFYMGMRPTVGGGLGDTFTYQRNYELSTSSTYSSIDFDKEWFFGWISVFCKSLKLNVTGYFLVVELGYIGFMLIASWKVLRENVWLAVLFAFSAFSFFTYGTNGIRNGLACSMVMAAVAFVAADEKKGVPWAIGLCVLALGVHRSTMLPIMCLLAATTVIKDTKTALYFWIASIPISLVAGGPIMNYFSSWEFDERMSGYATATVEGRGFSHIGFRWDFLLYSAMPVWLISYIVFQRNIKDRAFHIISTVYLLSNAFWVMVCRAAFSNRFAYLSWFLYPLVIAYPIIRMKIWKDQDMRAGWILLAHAGFSLLMFLKG